MKFFNLTVAGALFALCSTPAMQAADVTMHTPSGFQILGLSPNGKWACGVYVDAYTNAYGFRWNLDGGSIEMLGPKTSTAMDIANDGTVSGDYMDSSFIGNGLDISLPGFWRNGMWNALEMPKGKVTDGFGGGISPDGRYMTGSIDVNGLYTPFIWEDGAISRNLGIGNNHAVSYAVSPNGREAAGFGTRYNRTPAYWPEGQDIAYIAGDDTEPMESPWSYCRNFSPDGKLIVLWGGWDYRKATDTTSEELSLYAIYNTETGEKIKIPAPTIDSDLEFYDVSNNGMLVGSNLGRAYIWVDGKGMYFEDYLKELGVSLDRFDDFYSGTDYYQNQLPINNVVAVSEDEKTFAIRYYNKLQEPASMILKIDHNASLSAPAEVACRQLDGLSTVELKWKAPVGATGIRGFNVYRDGKKLNGFMPINVNNTYYYDADLADGTYSYTVGTVNTQGVETLCDPVEVTVGAMPLNAPYALYGRSKGINSAFLSWQEPLSNMVHKRYYNLGSEDISGFSIFDALTVEAAIRFDKNEMSQYAGYKVGEVSFYPMSEQTRWRINLYTTEDGALKLLGSQPVTQELRYGSVNTVKLDEPVDVPAGELYIAVEVETNAYNTQILGSELGPVTPGYSDLLRVKTDPDFFSCYESSAAGAIYLTYMSWGIDCGMIAPDGNVAGVESYNVYADGEMIASTPDLEFTVPGMEGNHTFGVEAAYPGARTSSVVETTFDVVANYLPVKDVDVVVDNTAITATWETPIDNDRKDITYSTDTKHAGGISGNPASGYAMMAGSLYPAQMMRGYDGYRIKSFRFYPLGDAIFTFMLYENDAELCYIEADEYTLGQWNEIEIPEDIRINENASYMLVIDCFDPMPEAKILAIDDDTPRPFVSDLFSTDNGANWKSMTEEINTHGNWMMGMVVVDADGQPVEADGFDVVADGKKINNETVTENTFSYDFGQNDDKRHTLRVDIYYPARTEAVKGQSTYFYITPSGIDGNYVADITLRQGDNYLIAEGDAIDGLAVYSAAGLKAAAAQGNTVDISTLTEGIYMVQITCAGKTETRKIRINR